MLTKLLTSHVLPLLTEIYHGECLTMRPLCSWLSRTLIILLYRENIWSMYSIIYEPCSTLMSAITTDLFNNNPLTFLRLFDNPGSIISIVWLHNLDDKLKKGTSRISKTLPELDWFHGSVSLFREISRCWALTLLQPCIDMFVEYFFDRSCISKLPKNNEEEYQSGLESALYCNANYLLVFMLWAVNISDLIFVHQKTLLEQNKRRLCNT